LPFGLFEAVYQEKMGRPFGYSVAFLDFEEINNL
jgi:hypothetical protein